MGDAIAELVGLPHRIDVRKSLLHPFQFFTECPLVADALEDMIEDVLRFEHATGRVGEAAHICPLLPCTYGDPCAVTTAFPEPSPDDEEDKAGNDDEEEYGLQRERV